MKTIEVDEELYAYFVRNTTRIGESASEILRRLLGLPGSEGNARTPGGKGRKHRNTYDAFEGAREGSAELADCLNDPRFLAQPDVIGKFLSILRYLYKRDPDRFSAVLEISGRRRKYFGKNSEELKQSGKSVNPQKIPDSPYWVVTNNDTPKKRRMLADVLRVLGYSSATIEQAKQALV